MTEKQFDRRESISVLLMGVLLMLCNFDEIHMDYISLIEGSLHSMPSLAIENRTPLTQPHARPASIKTQSTSVSTQSTKLGQGRDQYRFGRLQGS